MSILVLRHEPSVHLGSFAAILEENGRTFIYRDLGEPLDIASHTSVIVLGGSQSANDNLPGLHAELKLIEQALASGTPLLGICLGSQLIAKALGSRVYQNPSREIGWEPVHFTAAAADDPVFSAFASPTTLFHWHEETFDLPRGSEWLAYSEKCLHQAYRYGQNVYGVQFHPEITPDIILDWSAPPADCGDIDPHAVDAVPAARMILENWITVAEAPTCPH
jgi:GMP synthase (glutamine-hydrolysing)